MLVAVEKRTLVASLPPRGLQKYLENPLCWDVYEQTRGAAPAWREAVVPWVKKKRFASCRRIATAVVFDLRALIKEACFVWC